MVWISKKWIVLLMSKNTLNYPSRMGGQGTESVLSILFREEGEQQHE